MYSSTPIPLLKIALALFVVSGTGVHQLSHPNHRNLRNQPRLEASKKDGLAVATVLYSRLHIQPVWLCPLRETFEIWRRALRLLGIPFSVLALD